MTNDLKAPDWLERCDNCGWTLKEDRSAGCHELDCSFRPREGTDEHRRWKAGQSLSADERKLTRDYIRQLERNLEAAQAEIERLRGLCRELAALETDEWEVI